MKESASVHMKRVLEDEQMNDEEAKDEAVEGDEDDHENGPRLEDDRDAINDERAKEKLRKKEKFYNEVDQEEFF